MTSNRRLSPTMLRVLGDMIAGRGTHYRCYGLAEHGGRSSVLGSLYRRGLISRDYQVTDAGRAAVLEAQRLCGEIVWKPE